MITTALLRIWNRRTFKVLFAFLDQGIFSTSNFVLNILLARWLPEKEYGAFAVAFSLYILITTIQGGIVLEPMSVFGPKQEESLPDYVSKQLWFQLQINVFVAAVIFVISLFLSSPLREAMLGVAIATPITLIIWLYRRACYIKMQTGLAALISVVYSIGLFLGLFFLLSQHLLAPLTAFILMGIASFIATILLSPALHIHLPWNRIFHSFFIRDVLFRENWHYGKWIFAAMFSDSIINLIYIPFIAIFLTLQEAAGFKTMQNFIMPIQQIQATISLMLIPWLSKKELTYGNVLSRKSIFRVSMYYLLPSLLYAIPTFLFCKELTSILYKSGYYNNFIWMVPFLLLSSVFTSFTLSFAVTLRAAKLSHPLFWSKMSAAVLTIILGSICIYFLRLSGVILTLFVAMLVEFLVLILAVYRTHYSPKLQY